MSCKDCRPTDLQHAAPAYRRALRTVVILNLGMGLVEMAAGFIAHSQALKADALDFLGDGAITFLALLALSWSEQWRARAAFFQGLFLAALGFGVLVSTAFSAFYPQLPEATMMGGFAALGLIVNVLAAAVLVPHRHGDANARAVWLFSRNDAIGNAAVIASAALVSFTGTPWPDLIVAAAVAALFLQSSWVIIAQAGGEMRSGSQ